MGSWEAAPARHKRRGLVTEFIEYEGEKFWLQTTGRYFQSGDKTQPERLLHRRVWINARGEIPPGHAVHHKDGNWRNNDLNNLELMPIAEHMRLHMTERWKDPEYIERARFGLMKAREAAKAWHASAEGIQWHAENGKKVWADRKPLLVKCEVFLKEFETLFYGGARRCSKACRENHFYRKGFTDKRNCECCGAEFVANKHRKTRFCSRLCSNRSR